MTGAMYAAIAGLNSHMQKLNVIGNNTANVNTYGFKTGNMSFAESIYTTVNASSGGGTQYGGTNAAQIGYGSQVGTIDLNMTGGVFGATGLPSDLCLMGNGFFLVGDKAIASGGLKTDPNALTLSRDGRLGFDKDGYLVDSNGRCIYGFTPKGVEDTGAPSTSIDEQGATVYDWCTCLRPIRLPLACQNSEDGKVEGAAYYPTVDGTEQDYGDMELDGARIKADALNISVDSSGVIMVTNGTTLKAEVVGVIALGNVVNPKGLTKMDGPYYQAGGNSGDISVGTYGMLVTGNLNNADADTEGAIRIIGSDCKIQSGGLELSNTDIAGEFADLITTQRGFQANTKIITVTDEMLSDLVNMKR